MPDDEVLRHLGLLLRSVTQEVAAVASVAVEDQFSALRATLFVRRRGCRSYEGHVRYEAIGDAITGFPGRPPRFVIGEGLPGSCGLTNAVLCDLLEEDLLDELRGTNSDSHVRRTFGNRFNIGATSLHYLSVDGIRTREAYLSVPIALRKNSRDNWPLFDESTQALVSIDTRRRSDFDVIYPETDAGQRERDRLREIVAGFFFRNQCIGELAS